jgi:hypothetical protein
MAVSRFRTGSLLIRRTGWSRIDIENGIYMPVACMQYTHHRRPLRSHPCVAVSSTQVKSVYPARSADYSRRKTKLRCQRCRPTMDIRGNGAPHGGGGARPREALGRFERQLFLRCFGRLLRRGVLQDWSQYVQGRIVGKETYLELRRVLHQFFHVPGGGGPDRDDHRNVPDAH